MARTDGARASTQAQRVYAELRERLLRGDMPVGRRLVEQHLAAEFETSRTPVREALRRLEGDGHIVRDRGGVSPARAERHVDARAVRGANGAGGALRAAGGGIRRPRAHQGDRAGLGGAVGRMARPARCRAARTSSTRTRAFTVRWRATQQRRRRVPARRPQRPHPRAADLRPHDRRPRRRDDRRAPQIVRGVRARDGDAARPSCVLTSSAAPWSSRARRLGARPNVELPPT